MFSKYYLRLKVGYFCYRLKLRQFIRFWYQHALVLIDANAFLSTFLNAFLKF